MTTPHTNGDSGKDVGSLAQSDAEGAVILRGRDALGIGGIEITISGETITGIRPFDSLDAAAPWISPGLIDLQVNGHDQGDANAASPDPAQIEAMARSLVRHGVTRFLPTVITASPNDMLTRIEAVAAARRDPLAARMIAGVHVEGPSLSEQDGPRGVHPLEHIRPPTIKELQRWVRAADGLLRIVTLSPHHDGAVEATRFLVSEGVRVSIGHTHADDAQIRAVVDAGATLSTHLGNGAHGVLPRHPNYIWSQLAESRLSAGIIADGHHLPDTVIATMLAAKRDHGLFLVSDAVATPPALVEGGVSTVGGGVHLAADGALRHTASGFLAGSVQTLDIGLATVARITGSLATAVALASEVPGMLLDNVSPWRIGARADVVQFEWAPGDPSIRPTAVYVAGDAALDG